MKRAGLVTMAALIVACGFPRETWAGDEPAKQDFAKREAESQGLQDFRGGCPGPDGPTLILALLLAPLILPIYGLYKAGEWFISLFKREEPPWVPTPGPSKP